MNKIPDIRIASGRMRGRVLKSPKNAATHPMGAREKLALFNMVNVENATVLDAFAGSGAIGIEALSRGAKEVIFVENNVKICQTIRENLANLDIESEVFCEKVNKFAERSEFIGYFQVIFADPPYNDFDLNEVEKLVKLLSNDGILALSAPKEVGEIELSGLEKVSTHTYARAQIVIFRKK